MAQLAGATSEVSSQVPTGRSTVSYLYDHRPASSTAVRLVSLRTSVTWIARPDTRLPVTSVTIASTRVTSPSLYTLRSLRTPTYSSAACTTKLWRPAIAWRF